TDHGFIGKFSVSLVYPELIWHGVISDEDVRSSVMVEVRTHNPQTVSIRFVQSCRDRHVLKRAVSTVVKQRIHGWRFVVQRRAIVRQTPFRETVQFSLLRPLQVIDNDEVQVTISIIVEE